MNRHHAMSAAIAASLLVGITATQAQPYRERRNQPSWGDQVRQYPQRSRSPDLYSRSPGTQGVIGATTPNQWGNLGGPSTGGGSGGGP